VPNEFTTVVGVDPSSFATLILGLVASSLLLPPPLQLASASTATIVSAIPTSLRITAGLGVPATATECDRNAGAHQHHAEADRREVGSRTGLRERLRRRARARATAGAAHVGAGARAASGHAGRHGRDRRDRELHRVCRGLTVGVGAFDRD